MDFNSILIGSEDPKRLVDYYTKVLGEPTFADGGVHRLADRLRLPDGRARIREVKGRNRARAGSSGTS